MVFLDFGWFVLYRPAMSNLEANPLLVKSPDTFNEANTLTETLIREGQTLGNASLQTKALLQKTPITPLQLHDSNRIVDPILLSAGSNVALLTDAFGQAAQAVAKARPHWNVAGWVNDTKTFMNLQHMETPANLSFDKKPKAAKVDAILAVSWMHQMFSTAHYNVNALLQSVQDLLGLLPDDGQLLIQDFYLPEHPDRFVTLEIENAQTAEALLEFSHQVRPHAPKVMQGFFIERLSTPNDRVQRFHLPVKWAMEFYHRWRNGIAIDAPYELTTLPMEQWTALIEQCGARVTYRAPHILPRREAKEIQRELRFVDEKGEHMPLPPATFTLLIEKIPATTALQCYEHHVSREKAQDILISGFKDKQTEKQIDVVEIRNHEDDVLPWYRDAQQRLHVLVRSNVSRPIVNAVARGTPNLDGRHWAGYLIEPITVAHLQGELNQAYLQETLATQWGIETAVMGKASISAEYYPAPEYLAQRVRGIIMPLQKASSFNQAQSDGSRIIDVLADDVLRAISAGLIPDGKLEILIGGLMQDMGVDPMEIAPAGERPEAIRATRIVKDRFEVKPRRNVKSGEHLMEYIADTPAEKMRAVRSVFVEDRMSDYGRHIANYVEQEFIVPSNLSGNTAVCIPLVNDVIKGLMMSGEPRNLPIPERMGSSEPLLKLPSFSLPVSVKNLDEARQFLARQLGCEMDDLHVMGHSFFVQPQLSAERVYPFLLTSPSVGIMQNRWFKPRTRGLRRGLAPHVEKTTAYIEYRFGRDMGEWYNGFTPDIVNHMTQKITSASGNDNTTLVQNLHPAAQLKLI